MFTGVEKGNTTPNATSPVGQSVATPITLSPAPAYSKSVSTSIASGLGTSLTNAVNNPNAAGAIGAISNGIAGAGSIVGSGLSALDTGVKLSIIYEKSSMLSSRTHFLDNSLTLRVLKYSVQHSVFS
jgi:transcription elongation factor